MRAPASESSFQRLLGLPFTVLITYTASSVNKNKEVLISILGIRLLEDSLENRQHLQQLSLSC
jgi:hypothetical protein